MACRVVWSDEAARDLELIAEYIARDSPAYASSVVRTLVDAGRTLEQFPFAGRAVPEAAEPTLREVFVYSYRVIYRATSDAVTILAVIHGRRLLTRSDLPTGSP
jgi:plasmid stabilization system protein ParE